VRGALAALCHRNSTPSACQQTHRANIIINATFTRVLIYGLVNFWISLPTPYSLHFTSLHFTSLPTHNEFLLCAVCTFMLDSSQLPQCQALQQLWSDAVPGATIYSVTHETVHHRVSSRSSSIKTILSHHPPWR